MRPTLPEVCGPCAAGGPSDGVSDLTLACAHRNTVGDGVETGDRLERVAHEQMLSTRREFIRETVTCQWLCQ